MGGNINQQLLTAKEASLLYGYSPDYLTRLVRTGKVTGSRMGHNWFLDREDLKRYVHNQRAKQEVQQGYITLREASLLSGYTSNYLGVLVRAEKIKGDRISSSWHIDKDDLDKYLEAQNKKEANRQISGERRDDDIVRLEGEIQDLKDHLQSHEPKIKLQAATALIATVITYGVLAAYGYAPLPDTKLPSESLANLSSSANELLLEGEKLQSSAKLNLAAATGALGDIADDFQETYRAVNNRISSFFSSSYIKLVEAVIPGYSVDQQTSPVPLLPTAIVEEPSEETRVITREVTKEVITPDNTKLLTIEGDVSTLKQNQDKHHEDHAEDHAQTQLDLVALTDTVSSSNLSFTNSRLASLESFILASNRTASVSAQNNTQIKYILDNITAISLELQTNSDRVGLLVNQRGTENIIQFQDSGTDILTIADGGATTLSDTLTVSGATTLSSTLAVTGATTLTGAATLSDTLTVTGIATFSNTTTSINGVSYGWPVADGTSGYALSTNGTGQLSWTQAGVNDATYVTLSTNSSLTDERVLTGTANQITITDNGAGSTIVLSTPQDIAQSSSPTFTALTATTTLTINHTNAGDPYINFEDNGTDTWYLGFDNSDANKFRITPGGLFNATSSGITINLSGFVGIGTTNPTTALHVNGDITLGTTVIFSGGDTASLDNIDALNDTTETTIESAIDTLANLTSIQSLTVTLADAGANAILGWDDAASAYENLTQAEVLAVIGSAGLTAEGVIEIATIAETNTGTDATRAVSPDGLDGWTGSAQITTTGVLASGSIASGFGSILATTIDATTDFTIGATVITDGVLTDAGGFQMAAVLDMANNAITNIGGANSDWTSTLLTVGGFATTTAATGNIATAGQFILDVDGSGANVAGAITFGATNDAGIYFDNSNLVIITDVASAGIILDSEDDTLEFMGSGAVQLTFDLDGIDLITGNDYQINGTSVLTGTTLGSGVTASSLTSLGIIDSLIATSTLSLRHTNSGDPYINFQDNTTDTWYLGFDNSDNNKFRITPGAAFNATSSGITVNLAGFVGIGTTNPDATLSVSGDIDLVAFGNRIDFDTDNDTSIRADQDDRLAFELGATDRLLYSAAAFAFQEATTISTTANNNLTLTAGGTGDLLLTADSDTFVGIGDTSPDFLLDITSGSSASTTLSIDNTSTGDSQILLRNNGVDEWFIGYDDSDADKFRIASGAFSATSSGITIDAAGFVGIGTTNPTTALEVVGDIISKGTSWTARASATEANGWRSVTYGNGLFVAVSNGGTNRVMTSPDGINWTARASATEANGWQSVTYGNGLFVAVAASGTNRVMTSPDGINWIARTSATEANPWNSVTYGNGLFVAVAFDGTNRVMTSPDGITWTAIASATEANEWVLVTYGNGLFVAVSQSGTNRVMTSPDGITWTAIASATEANAWRSVTYGNGLFVAVSFSGTNRVMTSPDGINWTARVSATEANQWYSVTYGNGLFVALAGSGTNRVMTSPDGINWTARASATEANFWFSVTYANGLFVAVALSGTDRVMTSGKTEISALAHNNIFQGGMSIFGNVGIGTASPSHILTVSSADAASTTLAIANTNNGDLMINFIDSTTERWYLGYDDSDANKFRITPAGNFNATSSGLTINASGFVGIGTTSPTTLLDVNGALNAGAITGTTIDATVDFTIGSTVITDGVITDATGLQIAATLDMNNNAINNIGNANSDLTDQTWTHAFAGLLFTRFEAYGVTATGGPALSLRHSMNSSLGSHTAMALDDQLGNIDFEGSNGTAFFTGARINALATETWVDGDPDSLGSRLEFHTTDDGTATLDLRWTIEQDGVLNGEGASTIGTTSGNLTLTAGGTGDLLLTADSDTFVGIGDTSPDFLLDITSGSSASTTLSIDNTSTGDSQILLRNNGVDEWFIGYDDSDADKFRIASGAFSATSSGITIDAAGFVGIGTTNPTTALEVVGDITSKGTSWTSRTSAADNGWLDVTYGNGLFVAVGQSGTSTRAMISPDGVNWATSTSTADNTWTSVTYGNGIFVAVSQDNGDGSQVMTSPDGINWTSRNATAVNQWQDVTYGNGIFVAVSQDGTDDRVMTSPDGINWTSRDAITENKWRSITYGNSLFVAIALTGGADDNKRVMTSSDGITWASQTTPVNTNSWGHVTYGNGLFVAVSSTGSNDRVMTSPDGITWASRTSAADVGWVAVTYGNGLFVAVARDSVMTSPDGITWISRNAAASNGWIGVIYGNGIFVAVSHDGTGDNVMTSGKTEISALAHNNIFQGGLSIFGNVGIGTASPSHILTVSSADTASTTLAINNTSTGDVQLLFRNNGVDEWFIGYDDSQEDVFRITDTAFSATNATGLTIEAGGNVGIGTTNPVDRLDLGNGGLANVGAAGNDWTANALTLAGGSSNQLMDITTTGASSVSRLTLVGPASGTGELTIDFNQGAADGSANNMKYRLGYSANDGRMFLLSSDTDGASADADIWRVPDGQTTIDANTTWDINQFDYAEYMEKEDPNEAFDKADVVGIRNGKVTHETGDDVELIMAVTTAPGFRGGNPSFDFSKEEEEDYEERWIDIAFIGQVPVKVTGSAQPGDYLIPSGNNDGTATAVSPNTITSQQYRKTLGIVLSEFVLPENINQANTPIYQQILDQAAASNYDLYLVAVGVNQNYLPEGTQISFNSSLSFLTASSTSPFSFSLDTSTGSDILTITNSSSTNLLTIDSLGRLGIGTTSPTHYLTLAQGKGTAIADGWDVYSLEEYKTNIEYLGAADTQDILSKIKNVPIARYDYKTDIDNNTGDYVGGRTPAGGTTPRTAKHLGLIVETSPIEIISKTKQGISLYDLATFTLAGVKELANKQDELEARVAAIEIQLSEDGTLLNAQETSNDIPTISDLITLGSETFLAHIQDALETVGITLQEGFMKVAELVTGNLTTDKLTITRSSPSVLLQGAQSGSPSTSSGQVSSQELGDQIGEGVILSNATSTFIEAPNMDVYDKVFITLRTLIDQPLVIIEQKPGVGFQVAVKNPVQGDVYFDWWIVGVKVTETPAQNTSASSTPSTSPGQAESNATPNQATSTVSGTGEATTEVSSIEYLVSSTTTTESASSTPPDVVYPEISADYSDYLENIAGTGSDATSTSQNVQAATTTISESEPITEEDGVTK